MSPLYPILAIPVDGAETLPDWTVRTHPHPDGETADEVAAARADSVLAAAARAGGDVVLVGHGHFSRVLAARYGIAGTGSGPSGSSGIGSSGAGGSVSGVSGDSSAGSSGTGS